MPREKRSGHATLLSGGRALFLRALVLSAIAAAALSVFRPAAAGEATEAPVTGPQVRAAILRGIEALKHTQAASGGWADYAQEGGVTALAAYALLTAGVAPDDKAVAAALGRLGKSPSQATYVVSLRTLAFAAADPVRHKKEIQAGADWLVEMQNPTGAWGYGKPPPGEAGGTRSFRNPQSNAALQAARAGMEARRAYERPDTSNTQFAVLALAEAERAGATVPLEVWRKADRHFRATQLPGGGWGYVYHDADPEEAYGSMTAAAVASLYLCNERLSGKEPAEATAERLATIERGIGWIVEHYTLRENPKRALAWYYFWLYALERTGVASGRRMFGEHDWFREGTDLLVHGQRPDGTWTDRTYHDALCLLFLAKGYRPLLVQRLEWDGPWRRDPRDLQHLTRYLGRRVGGDFVDWRTLAPDAPVTDYLAAPILHVAGTGPLRMLAGSLPRLKAYVEQGGLILFDAEGASAAFADSVRRLMADQFAGAKFEPLTAAHPLCDAVHKIAPPAGIEIMTVGCRASVILAARGLGDGWAEAGSEKATDALRFGENLAVYATGAAPLPDRLAEARLLESPPDEPPPRGAVRIGQIQHDGDWQPRPHALPALLKDVSERFGVAVAVRPVPVKLTDANLGQFPILYMTGHYSFHLTDAERDALRGYLERGGFLWAEACCGRAAFDKSLRDLAAAMFPDVPLKELPADHAIYSGKVGTKIESVEYAPAVKATQPDLRRPVLFGLERDGHVVLMYSPYGLAPGLDGLRTWGARALAPDDARRVAANILLYAMQP